jgi:Tol biopolymer transport system component
MLPKYGILNRSGVVISIRGLPAGWNLISPAVSPDGRYVAFAGVPPDQDGRARANGPAVPSEIVVFTLPGGPYRMLDPGHHDALPVWMPDTDMIVFRRDTNEFVGGAEIMMQKADGSEPAHTLVRHSTLMLSSTTWFPDGRRAIIAHNGVPRARDGRLMEFSVDHPSELKPIIADEMLHSHPQLSPDGQLLAFVAATRATGRNGAFSRADQHVRIYRFSDSSVAKVDLPNGTHPRWSSDGTELFVQSDGLHIVKVNSAAKLTVQRPARVPFYNFYSSVLGFAVLPGDSLFVVPLR